MRKGIWLIIMVALLGWSLVRPAAADDGQATLVATADGYVDAREPDTNLNGRPLQFALASVYDDATGLYCPALTRLTYIRFDLASVPFPIDKAQLVLSQPTCGGSAAPLQLFAAGDGWSEQRLTWNNRPATEYLLPEAAEFVEAGRVAWTDAGSADALAGLADWLAFQQALGVPSVTLGIIMPLPAGCTPLATPSYTLLFEDRERSSALADPCVGTPEAPLLHVAAADSDLPARSQGPTAVTLVGAATTATPVVALLLAGCLLLLATARAAHARRAAQRMIGR